MDEARLVIERLRKEKKTLVTAESCTGGLLGKLLTDAPGASQVYLGGLITYAYELKEKLLQVDTELLRTKGAVCEQVAISMAENARHLLHADVALAITGNAGPGTDEKNPNVGEIYVACADAEHCVCKKLNLHGNREENRLSACIAVLEMIS